MNPDSLESIFVKWSLLDWWDTLLQAYKEMGFTDKIDDDTRIKEFSEITKLMNSWIEKVEKTVTPFWPLKKDKGIEAFSQMSERTILNSRTRVVYVRIRDNWNEIALAKLKNILIEEARQWEEEEEGSDSYGYRFEF